MMPDRLPEVFSVAEIAAAAGVRPRDVMALIAAGGCRSIDGQYLTVEEAVRAVRQLNGSAPDRHLFLPRRGQARRPGMPLAVSGSLHAGLAAAIVLLTTMGMAGSRTQIVPDEYKAIRMVFLATPGPGGGGGGGGLKQPAPPPKAELKGERRIHSPLPVRRPPPPIDPPPVQRVSDPPPPPPLKAEPLPPIVAPIAQIPADNHDRIGVPAETPAQADSHGPGRGGGAGSGQGTGLGPGDGSGVGPGSGGGTGGGPYRPGSGITPPSILREVKPDYTEEGRRRSIEGDVVMEIVVRRDGTVGDVRVLQGLGGGLDQRAVDAVRQWRFNPARRLGAPVDVIVEVAVEFKLR
jgi:periplasmic protein TonB